MTKLETENWLRCDGNHAEDQRQNKGGGCAERERQRERETGHRCICVCVCACVMQVEKCGDPPKKAVNRRVYLILFADNHGNEGGEGGEGERGGGKVQ